MTDAQSQFIISLFLLLATSLLAGELALRLGQVALVGQLLTGIILGPYLVGQYLGISSTPELSAVQFLAAFFILFMAGLEMGPEQIYGMSSGTFLTGVLVFFVPFTSCFAATFLLFPGMPILTALFIAVTLSITALPIMGILMTEFGLTKRRLGALSMGVALVNELTAVTVFAILLQIHNAGAIDARSFAIAIVSVALFLAVILTAYHLLEALREERLWKALLARAGSTVRTREGGFAILMVLAMGAALLSQGLGLTFVVGAFYAGILVTPESLGHEAYRTVKGLLSMFTWGFFLPLFFAITGIQVDLTLFASAALVGTLIALFSVAAVAKVGAGTAAATAQDWEFPDALAFGFMVNCRGAVEIAMAVILFGDGILTNTTFTLVVTVGLITTIMAPIGALRAWMLTEKSRADLYLRIPTLRWGRGRPPPPRPLSWEELHDHFHDRRGETLPLPPPLNDGRPLPSAPPLGSAPPVGAPPEAPASTSYSPPEPGASPAGAPPPLPKVRRRSGP